MKQSTKNTKYQCEMKREQTLNLSVLFSDKILGMFAFAGAIGNHSLARVHLS